MIRILLEETVVRYLEQQWKKLTKKSLASYRAFSSLGLQDHAMGMDGRSERNKDDQRWIIHG